MKIDALRILNFRGIGDVALENLGNMVIIAGQNGSGKSCIFDAIRLLKSVYGGYQANEWQQWMGEFQINLASRSSDFLPIFNDRSKELKIVCSFKLSKIERQFILDNADELLREHIWRTLVPEAYAWGGVRLAMFASQLREREPEVTQRVKIAHPKLVAELAAQTVQGIFSIRPGELPQINESLVLSVAFSTFRPKQIGVIDYHGAQRHYGRESVQGINLNLDANEQQHSHHALYNYANKYNNVKSEMAASYVKEILAEQAGISRSSQSTLTSTLEELFETFFPDKKFLGPQPTSTGLLTFPVETPNGGKHDLDDLSSGEKEILYGYLRIRNSAPRFSIILLDEPELHLNPRLIRGLPQFYRKNLGEALENQIWLVTHSDALLREVVGRDSYNVYHMLPQMLVRQGQSQLRPLSATADLDIALADLVGDLAAYRPGGKVIILEGGGDSDFDQKVVSGLFPELAEHANLISGTNKIRVKGLQEILQRAATSGAVPFTFFSITDRDSDVETGSQNSRNSFSWNVYHLENYFLVPKYIDRVLVALSLGTSKDEDLIWDELRECAKETISLLIRHELATYANNVLVRSIEIKTDPKQDVQSAAVFNSIEASFSRLEQAKTSGLSQEILNAKESELRADLTRSIADGTWVTKFRGRDVLKRYVSKAGLSISYEVFRNLLLSQMRDDGYRPSGMAEVVQAIMSAN